MPKLKPVKFVFTMTFELKQDRTLKELVKEISKLKLETAVNLGGYGTNVTDDESFPIVTSKSKEV